MTRNRRSSPCVIEPVKNQGSKVIKQFIISDDLDIAALIIVSQNYAFMLRQIDRAANDNKTFGFDSLARSDDIMLWILTPPSEPIIYLLKGMGDLIRLVEV